MEPKCKLPLVLPPLSGPELVAHAWSDEEICCYGVLSSPRGNVSTANLFDVRLRRWYTITADNRKPAHAGRTWHSITDPFWRDTLRKTGHRGRNDFDHIDVEPTDGSLSLSTKHLPVVHALYLHVPPKEPALEPVLYRDLQDRRYLENLVESCMWRSQRYAFKQILMGTNAAQLNNEISITNCLVHSPYIVHIKAYVVDEDDDLRGVLLPWSGDCIDILPSVRWSYFRDLAYALRDIHSSNPSNAGAVGREFHGDVFCRNILVQDGVARLIDLGNPGLAYPGDREAFSNVISSLIHKAEGEFDKSRMEELVSWLGDGMGFSEIAAAMEDW